MDFSKKTTVIFDVDGVLVDSEVHSCGALSQILFEECGIITGDDFSDVLGTSNKYAIKHYLDKSGMNFDNSVVDDLVFKKQIRYKDLATKSLQSFSYCEEFIKLLLEKNIQLTVASSGSIDKIKFSLKRVGFLKYFSVINSADEVVNGKPAPDLFNLSMKRMNVNSEECIVIEDSLLGISASRSAGIDVFGFAGSFERSDIEDAGAVYFDDYSQLIEIFKSKLI